MTDPTSRPRVDLWELLPSVHRMRDAANGHQLRALVTLVSEQASILKTDIERLEDDLFIETCSEWVIPYIGDLIANAPIHALRTPRRADVANTIGYRRRKGTHAMLERLAGDVTGWSVCLVEMFEKLGWTQNQNHRRPSSQWLDVRSQEACTRIGGAFDPSSRTVDVRPPSQLEGLPAVRNLAFFLFRIAAMPLVDVPAKAASVVWGRRFDPLGACAPLFQRSRRSDGRVTELDVATAIRREKLFVDLAASPSELYGDFATGPATEARASFHVRVDGTSIPQAQIRCARLRPWPSAPPSGSVVAVDVESGRLALGDGFAGTNAVDVSFHRGLVAELGGGTYARDPVADPNAFTMTVREGAVPVDASGPHPSVDAALNVWRAMTPAVNTVLRIEDSRTYSILGPVVIEPGRSLVIEAARGERPVLVTDAAVGLSVGAPTAAALSSLRFDGVAIEGWLHVDGDLGKLRLLHSTILPGRSLDDEGVPLSTAPSIVIEATAGTETINGLLDVEIERSIVGTIQMPSTTGSLSLVDSVLDGLDGVALSDAAGTSGPEATLEQVTVFGSLHARELFASNCIFTDRIDVDRVQSGCVRFSWLPPHTSPPSRAPRRYRCQPELAVERALAVALEANPSLSLAEQDAIAEDVRTRIVPSFTRRRFGDPAYAQLALRTPREIKSGADDEGEMGALHLNHEPQLETNLRVRLEEYAPFGLDVALIYVT